MRIESIAPFMQDVTGILKRLSDRSSVTLGFNAFELVSDSYKKENLHSDILRAILDPNSNHGERVLFLRLFIQYLEKVARKQGKPCVADELKKLEINESVCVLREDGRVDVLIAFADKAIIIENKINGADDMVRQLPRYVEYVEKEKTPARNVVAIVYLTSAQPKEPNFYGWTDLDKEKVMSLLLSVVGFSEEYPDLNLVQGWLSRCQLSASRFASVAVLSQYCELLRNQAGVTMNNKLMKEFLEQMARNKIDYFELKEIIMRMPQAIASMVIESCAEKPGLKKKPWIAYEVVSVFDFDGIQVLGEERMVDFAVDVHCEDLGKLGVTFFARSGNTVPIANYLPILQGFDQRFKFDEKVWTARLVLQLSPKEAYADLKAFIEKISDMVDFLVRKRNDLGYVASGRL